MSTYGVFHIPPRCQGQIVEVAYCQVGDVLLRRTTDQGEPVSSPDRVSYDRITLDDDEVEAVEPWNVEPSVRGDWTPITEARARQIVDPGPHPAPLNTNATGANRRH